MSSSERGIGERLPYRSQRAVGSPISRRHFHTQADMELYIGTPVSTFSSATRCAAGKLVQYVMMASGYSVATWRTMAAMSASGTMQ